MLPGEPGAEKLHAGFCGGARAQDAKPVQRGHSAERRRPRERCYGYSGRGRRLPTNEALARSRAFVDTAARPIDRALCALTLGDAATDPEAMADALARYANGDGGFGHALEPDFRLAESSLRATTVGLRMPTRRASQGRGRSCVMPSAFWPARGTRSVGAGPPCPRA